MCHGMDRFYHGTIQCSKRVSQVTKIFLDIKGEKMDREVYLILFAGQSNMGGRGCQCERWPMLWPNLADGAAYEYRAVTAPDRLCVLKEPFGVLENRADGINDVSSKGVPMKTGSLVTAFCNAFYEKTKISIVGVSAAKGGSSLKGWVPGAEAGYFEDMAGRYLAAEKFLTDKGYRIKDRLIVWTQGESDGDKGTAVENYIKMFETMWTALKEKTKITRMFLIKTGECNIEGSYNRYREIQEAQEELCIRNEDVIMCSRAFCGMRKQGLMRDAFHYYQQGYNLCGTEAGNNAAERLLSDK